jgi:hypothetical protein
MKIIIDYREKASGIIDLLQLEDIETFAEPDENRQNKFLMKSAIKK